MKTERILGALYGQALGDAMGMPSELWPRSRVKAHFGWIDRFLPGPKENNAACYFNRAEFTDDTSMALCLADALLERKGKIDPDLIGPPYLCQWQRCLKINQSGISAGDSFSPQIVRFCPVQPVSGQCRNI